MTNFSALLGVLFIGLKLTNYITWPWIWVVSPLWIPLAISISILVITAALVALATLISAVIDYINWW
jgi:hypothetical protein